MKKKVCIVGHFGNDQDELLNGQTIKTKTIWEALVEKYGDSAVVIVDSSSGKRGLIKIAIELFRKFKISENIIIMPAENGLLYFVPLCSLYNSFFHRKLHYIVVGGWLPEFLIGRDYIKKRLRKFTGIYVETKQLKVKLEENCLDNVMILPNFKNIPILDSKQLVYFRKPPFAFCTFSRVMIEKGIEDAVMAIKQINEECGKAVCTLDIYGQIEASETKWFNDLKKEFPSYIRYCGSIPSNQSIETVKKYYGLLFPTYYEGEGFAGTLIDAFASGVPVVASDWKYNAEVVEEKVNGLIFAAHDIPQLKQKIVWACSNTDIWNEMKMNCIRAAEKYKPSIAISILELD